MTKPSGGDELAWVTVSMAESFGNQLRWFARPVLGIAYIGACNSVFLA